MHLGMSGSFRIDRSEPIAGGAVYYRRGKDAAHDHVVLHMRGGTRVIYNDPRRFGFMLLIEADEMETHPLLAGLGLEPSGNGLSAAKLAPRLQRRAAPLKAVLGDQRVVAGLGNIYVCEALWRARLSPRRSAGTLVKANGRPTERLDRLVEAVKAVIADAVAAAARRCATMFARTGSWGCSSIASPSTAAKARNVGGAAAAARSAVSSSRAARPSIVRPASDSAGAVFLDVGRHAPYSNACFSAARRPRLLFVAHRAAFVATRLCGVPDFEIGQDRWPTQLRPRRRSARSPAARPQTRFRAPVCGASSARSRRPSPPAIRRRRAVP
jgi:hypothetical protein